jgi:hypothetical protein
LRVGSGRQRPNQALQQTAGHDAFFVTTAHRCPAAAELGRSAAEGDWAVQAADIHELSLDRGPCFGTCPVFRFTASRQYGYTYSGRRHAVPPGDRAGRFPHYLFDRLAEVCVELRVLELDDVYPSDFDDAPSVAVSVRHAGGVKVVRNEGGDSGPVRLWAFAALIEVAMRQAFEVEDRDAARQPQSKARRTRRCT